MHLISFGNIGFEMKIFHIHTGEVHPRSYYYLPLKCRYCKIITIMHSTNIMLVSKWSDSILTYFRQYCKKYLSRLMAFCGQGLGFYVDLSVKKMGLSFRCFLVLRRWPSLGSVLVC